MTSSAPALHVETRGAARARTTLLLHGGGVGGWMWRPLAEHLPPDRRLVIPDLPGHDRSGPVPYCSHEQTLDALVSVVRAHADEPVSVVGFSLGGQLAVLLAARHPGLVRDVTVISAQAVPSRAPAAVLALLRAAAPLARLESFARAQARELGVPADLMDDYLRTSTGMGTDSLLAAVGENIRFTIPPGWADFPGRAFVVAGGRERAVVRRSAQRLAAAHPRSGLAFLPGCRHDAPLRAPEELAGLLTRWWGGY